MGCHAPWPACGDAAGKPPYKRCKAARFAVRSAREIVPRTTGGAVARKPCGRVIKAGRGKPVVEERLEDLGGAVAGREAYGDGRVEQRKGDQEQA